MFPTIQVGPLNIQAPGLIIIISLWVGLNLAEKFAKRRSFPADKLYNLVFISLVAGILGARLFFFLGNLNSFTGNIANIFSLNPGLLDPFGGLVAATLAAVIYGQRNKLPFWETLDALTPLFAVLMIGIGFSHLSSGNAYGIETSMPWGINLWGGEAASQPGLRNSRELIHSRNDLARFLKGEKSRTYFLEIFDDNVDLDYPHRRLSWGQPNGACRDQIRANCRYRDPGNRFLHLRKTTDQR